MDTKKRETLKGNIRKRFEKPAPMDVAAKFRTTKLPMPSAEVTVCDYLKIIREIIEEQEEKYSVDGVEVFYSVEVGGLVLSLDHDKDFRIRFVEEAERPSRPATH